LKDRSKADITTHLQFEQLACILELLAKKSKKLKTRAGNLAELSQKIAVLTGPERQNIKDQVLAFTVPAIGGLFVLDPAISSSKMPSASAKLEVKFQRSVSSTGMVKSDKLLWLKEQKGPTVLRDVKHRHSFNRDVNFGGLLTSSQFSSVHLMEAWPAELQSKAAEVHPGFAKKEKLDDCQLVCVKIANCAEGQKRLQREGAALQALQHTGRVAELWNPGELARYLDNGVLITIYHPVPPPPDPGHDTLLSLDELEDRVEELARTLHALHSHGWIWLGLKPSHILFLHARMDPRDHLPPLRVIGLENARCLLGTDSCEYVPDLIWNAPEVKMQELRRQQKAKGLVSADRNYIDESDITPAADMYSLGLLVNAHLARSPLPLMSSNDELCTRFNALVYNTDQQISSEHWLVGLAGDLIQTVPGLRPTAKQVLQRISSGRRQRNQAQSQLQRLEPSISQIDGYIHPDTLHMVWPVFLQTTVITDQRNALRLTDYVTVHAAVATPPRKMVADYKGRPVTKAYLLWLRHLKLHSHALNDGEWGAYDGRRKCNGIFDMAYYKKFRQVQSNPNSSFKHR
jgi:hypothetical protein